MQRSGGVNQSHPRRDPGVIEHVVLIHPQGGVQGQLREDVETGIEISTQDVHLGIGFVAPVAGAVAVRGIAVDVDPGQHLPASVEQGSLILGLAENLGAFVDQGIVVAVENVIAAPVLVDVGLGKKAAGIQSHLPVGVHQAVDAGGADIAENIAVETGIPALGGEADGVVEFELEHPVEIEPLVIVIAGDGGIIARQLLPIEAVSRIQRPVVSPGVLGGHFITDRIKQRIGMTKTAEAGIPLASGNRQRGARPSERILGKIMDHSVPPAGAVSRGAGTLHNLHLLNVGVHIREDRIEVDSQPG